MTYKPTQVIKHNIAVDLRILIFTGKHLLVLSQYNLMNVN